MQHFLWWSFETTVLGHFLVGGPPLYEAEKLLQFNRTLVKVFWRDFLPHLIVQQVDLNMKSGQMWKVIVRGCTQPMQTRDQDLFVQLGIVTGWQGPRLVRLLQEHVASQNPSTDFRDLIPFFIQPLGWHCLRESHSCTASLESCVPHTEPKRYPESQWWT